MSDILELIKKHSVTYDTAHLLYAIHYDETCLSCYMLKNFHNIQTVNRFNLLSHSEVNGPSIVAAPLITQAREWLNKTYGLYFTWYETETKRMYNYFIFEKGKVIAKGSLPQFDILNAEKLACYHAVMAVHDIFYERRKR